MPDDDRPGWGLPTADDPSAAPPPAPTAPPPPAPTAPSAARRRAWRVVAPLALSVALLVAALGAGVAAWRNYEAGAAWQERAAAESERAGAAEALLAAEQERAAALERRVAELETEVADLEERLISLAGEKAGAEDEALVAQDSAQRLQETAERLAELSRFATETGASLRHCISLSLELTDDIVAAVNEDALDPAAANRRIAEVNDVCGRAQADHEELRRRVDALAP